MSFFSSNAKPAKSKRPFGLNEGRTTQHESGPVKPFWQGTQRVGTTVIVEPFDFDKRPAPGQKKAGKSGGIDYATVVISTGLGLLDRLHSIWINEDRWWNGPLDRVDGEESVPITIEDFGSGLFYWGSETQPIDPTLAATGLLHPAYRPQAYFVFPHAKLGQNTSTVPNFEVIASRWGNLPEGWSRTPAANGIDVNPINAVVEVLTNPRVGRAVPAEWINFDSLIAVRDRLTIEGLAISPLLDSGVTLRQFLADICEYIGGWYRTDDLGRFTMGLYRGGTLGQMISEHTLVSEPTVKPGSWLQTASSVQLVYTNSARYWLRESVVGTDRANALITGQLRSPVKERPWVTDPAIAARMADVEAQRNGRPWATGRLTVRPSRVPGIAPGDIRRLSYGHLGLVGQPVRVLAIDSPAPGTPEIGVEISFDVGAMNAVYADPPEYVPPPDGTLVPVPATYQDLWSLPPALGGSNRYPWIALLCSQPSKVTDSFYGHIEIAGGGYDSLVPESSNFFSIRAKVKTAIGTSGNIDIILLGGDTDLGRYSIADFTEGRVVAWVGGEVVELTGYDLIAAGEYTLLGSRAGMGTTAASHAVDDAVWLVRSDRIYSREIRTGSATTVTMKIQPAIRGVKVDLASCTPMTISADPAYSGPRPPTLLEAFGSATPTWVGAVDIPITWAAADEYGPVATVLEFWDPAGPTLVDTINVGVAEEEYTWPYASAVAALGGTPITFEIRAKHRVGSRLSWARVLTVTV